MCVCVCVCVGGQGAYLGDSHVLCEVAEDFERSQGTGLVRVHQVVTVKQEVALRLVFLVDGITVLLNVCPNTQCRCRRKGRAYRHAVAYRPFYVCEGTRTGR